MDFDTDPLEAIHNLARLIAKSITQAAYRIYMNLGITVDLNKLETTRPYYAAKNALDSNYAIERIFQWIVFKLYPEVRKEREDLAIYLEHLHRQEYIEYLNATLDEKPEP